MLDLDTGESFADFARANSLARYLKQAGELALDCFTAGSSTQVGGGIRHGVAVAVAVEPEPGDAQPFAEAGHRRALPRR